MESESEAANQIDVAADRAAVAVGRQAFHAVTAGRCSVRCRGRTRRTVVHHSHRGRRRQRASARDGQHVAHADVLPLRDIAARTLNDVAGTFRLGMVSGRIHRRPPPCQAEQHEHQPVCKPFRHVVEIQSAYTNGRVRRLLPTAAFVFGNAVRTGAEAFPGLEIDLAPVRKHSPDWKSVAHWCGGTPLSGNRPRTGAGVTGNAKIDPALVRSRFPV